MNILELHKSGVIEYLHRKGLLSSSTISYIEYYQSYLQERDQGFGYRETVRKLSKEFHVSETTIKKAIRVIQNGDSMPHKQTSPEKSMVASSF
jgi:hypothetical protein